MLLVRNNRHIDSVMDGGISYLVGAAKGKGGREGLFIVGELSSGSGFARRLRR